MSSIGYYDKNSKDFYDRTINIDVQDLYKRFLKYIPQGGRILDTGCGVGRDSKFFVSSRLGACFLLMSDLCYKK
jgi:ubiquinone/menaquinone biosynthesis C-methylase UbiE